MGQIKKRNKGTLLYQILRKIKANQNCFWDFLTFNIFKSKEKKCERLTRILSHTERNLDKAFFKTSKKRDCATTKLDVKFPSRQVRYVYYKAPLNQAQGSIKHSPLSLGLTHNISRSVLEIVLYQGLYQGLRKAWKSGGASIIWWA